MTAAMASIISQLREFLDTGTESVVYECRDCGTSVDGEVESCPNCESDRIVTHRLE